MLNASLLKAVCLIFFDTKKKNFGILSTIALVEYYVSHVLTVKKMDDHLYMVKYLSIIIFFLAYVTYASIVNT